MSNSEKLQRWIIFQEDEAPEDVPEKQRSWDTFEEVLTMFDSWSDEEDCPHRIVWLNDDQTVGRVETAEKGEAASGGVGRDVCCHIRNTEIEDQNPMMTRVVERIVRAEDLILIEPKEVGPFKIHKGGKSE